MVDLAGEERIRGRHRGGDFIDDVAEEGGDLFGILDRTREGHRTSHRGRIGSKSAGVRCGVSALCEPIPTADDLYRVGESQFVVAGKLGLERRCDELLVHRQHEHLVVAQQVGAHCLAKAETMELFTVEIWIIHRAEQCISFSGFALALVGVQAGRRGHIQALLGPEEPLVMHADKGRLILAGSSHTGGPMCFVADDEVELGQSVGLSIMNDLDGLVGREDNRHVFRG